MVDPLTISAIGWGMTGLSWLISPILSRFINKCFDTLGKNVPKMLLYFEETLVPELKIIMEAAQQSPHRSTLEKWLQKLKEAFYEAEDVLDLVEYERREREVKSQSTSKFLLPFHSPQKKKLLKSLQKLKKLVIEARDDIVPLFNLPSSSNNSMATSSTKEPYRVTTSSPPPLVIGRDEDRDRIVKLLCDDSPESSSNSNCFSVIGIYGVGGSGKTTLVQYVCKHEREAKQFDLVMWVHVSREFDVYAILSKMWESVSDKSCSGFKNLDVLESKIKDRLSGKKFLLVLDDVWFNKDVSTDELDQLFAPLRTGEGKSKILVTTRMENVAKALGCSNPIQLRELDQEQFLKLFMHYAFREEIHDKNLELELKMIGKKIAEKLHKSPLAARTIAGQLSKWLNPTFWSSMLSKDLLNSTKGTLFLSYQHLDPQLQRCFAFCSLFPKGKEFKNNELVDYWIAEQFIETEHTNEHVKYVAECYIHELISMSFIQHEMRWGENYYSVHDLLHDLSEDVTRNEYFKIESDERLEIPVQIRHLFVGVGMQREHIQNIHKLEGLRTIIILGKQSNLTNDDFNALFTKLKKLRVVFLSSLIDSISKTCLPKSIAHLKHLRYLSARNIRVENYKQFNELYHLCFLHTNENISQIPDFGRLRSMLTIPYFSVTKNKGIELKQFENLRDLYGSLILSNLENVRNTDEALAAHLSNKTCIKKLRYIWRTQENEGDRRNMDVEILEGLCPPPQITDISISGYQSQRYPNWISEINHSASNLHHLELKECNYLESLPKSLELLPILLSLSIKKLPRLKIWQPLLATLTKLYIKFCHPLLFLCKAEFEIVMSSRDLQMSQVVAFLQNCSSKLAFYTRRQFEAVDNMIKASDDVVIQTLSLDDPEDLQTWLGKRLDLLWQLPDANNKLILPSSLTELEIESCAITNNILWQGLQGATSLTSLLLSDIITITCIPKEVMSCLNKLQRLEIMDCLLLNSLGGLEALCSLKTLKICSSPLLTLNTTTLPPSLTKLQFQAWNPPTDIFCGLVSLEFLLVDSCPSIECPYIGCSKKLTELEFINCSNLYSIRGLNELPKLHSLVVLNNPKLKSVPVAARLSTLQLLDIDDISLVKQLLLRDCLALLHTLYLHNLQEESFEVEQMEVFMRLSSLKSLRIIRCKNLSLLTDLPASLEHIFIAGCNLEFMESCKESDHPNCLKLAHVIDKEISDF